MNKQEAIKHIEQMGEYERFVDELVSKKSVLNIISQIDQLQEVVIPKFVAEWIEYYKDRRNTLYFALIPTRMSKELNEWMALGNNDDIFVRAWLDGYEVEKEKLYTVELPNPNNIGTEAHVLMMNGFKQVVIKKELGNDWKKKKEFQLTEAEIKKDFEWAWQFAEEVE